MANLANINQQTITVPDKGITEPLGGPQTPSTKLINNFPVELYSHSRNGLLYKFLTTLVGDAGTNAFKKQLLYPRLTNSLFNTHFNDIDAFYGSVFNFNRIEEEIYSQSPLSELLEVDEWQEIRRKDSWYRARCLEYMRALQLGTTPAGIALACQAASGIECDIVERWRHLDDDESDEPIGITDIGITNSRQEFIIIPRTATLTPKQARRISNILHRIKPINTIFTIAPQEKPRIEIPIQDITTSSTYFQAQRLVTGNKSIRYPPVDKRTGLWIEPGVEKEAPTFAFGNRSEFITWPTILQASATSVQVGPFNLLQRNLFPHLENAPDQLYQFDANQAFSNIPIQLEITEPWLNRSSQNVLINNHFPLGYFADPDVHPNIADKFFWASIEKMPPAGDTLDIEFDSERTINYIEFEVSTKPITFDIQYFDEATTSWFSLSYIDNDNINNDTTVVFTSSNNSWYQAQLIFQNIRTRHIRIVFTRQDTPFPYATSPPFEWSIEVRGLRVASIVTSLDDFQGSPDPTQTNRLIGDGGIDILGNSYRTVVEPNKYSGNKTVDGELDTFWQSQTNPSRFAVESIYIDISDNGDPTTVDEIFIDPITAGCLMHIYWSNDEPGIPPLNQAQDDWRLWNPIPRHYILTKGYHSLKKSITAKYLKLEFTKLIPQPYTALEVPIKSIRYKTHPSWVQEYIKLSLDIRTKDSPIEFANDETVTLNYINLGLNNPNFTKLDTEEPTNLEQFLVADNSEFNKIFETYQTWTKRTQESLTIVQSQKESDISVYTRLFTEDLPATLHTDLFINRVILNQGTDGIFIDEAPLVDKQLINVASRNDRILADQEKNYPDMWFPRTARHAYMIIDAQRASDIGYNVAIREIVIYRRDNTFPIDSPLYTDTLTDSVNIESNTFVNADWRLIVSDEFLGEGTSGLGDEDFDEWTEEREVFL